MRTRQKLTAVGALALATTAVGGGAVVTSHAMADTATPEKGTMTVISMRDGSDEAIKCVYDDIDLPTVAVGVLATANGDLPNGGAVAINVESGTGPVDENGDPIPGGVIVSSGSMELPDGQLPDPSNVVVNRPVVVTHTTGGEATPADADLPALPPGAILLDTTNARPGTAEECAAMKPTTAAPPFVTTP
jgi:hypothetical protein